MAYCDSPDGVEGRAEGRAIFRSLRKESSGSTIEGENEKKKSLHEDEGDDEEDEGKGEGQHHGEGDELREAIEGVSHGEIPEEEEEQGVHCLHQACGSQHLARPENLHPNHGLLCGGGHPALNLEGLGEFEFIEEGANNLEEGLDPGEIELEIVDLLLCHGVIDVAVVADEEAGEKGGEDHHEEDARNNFPHNCRGGKGFFGEVSLHKVDRGERCQTVK